MSISLLCSGGCWPNLTDTDIRRFDLERTSCFFAFIYKSRFFLRMMNDLFVNSFDGEKMLCGYFCTIYLHHMMWTVNFTLSSNMSHNMIILCVTILSLSTLSLKSGKKALQCTEISIFTMQPTGSMLLYLKSEIKQSLDLICQVLVETLPGCTAHIYSPISSWASHCVAFSASPLSEK